ncbi:PadR family transcriptional regulator, partial [Kitasatospora sp. NPDC058263]
MALEHAILVSLLEQPGSGYELARRFDRSIGRFWTATHQQIYRVLRRMEADGWISAEEVAQDGRPDKKVYSAATQRTGALAGWLREPVEP